MTLQALISACPAPVSTDAGVSSAMEWIEIVNVFAIKNVDNVLPNAMYIRNLSEVFAKNTILKSTDYDSINNNLMHLKVALSAVLENAV